MAGHFLGSGAELIDPLLGGDRIVLGDVVGDVFEVEERRGRKLNLQMLWRGFASSAA
jgi:hypothetical protein